MPILKSSSLYEMKLAAHTKHVEAWRPRETTALEETNVKGVQVGTRIRN